ncbi:type II toxin-antitoxin system RelE/ParE family toxin [Rahnella aquatilis]|uniref:Plasmid stabilization system protein n=1 Tax=Rahnella aquatilis (strain ATCC 33071 / DSM 4594 / JCM 1683 / NBRC 105701 / NCIMB 13365 / CIP 78.65) TaxID=745277 RepID=H2J0J2_RAHAC|nr:type II toxin-antitoxin system RelE/ParE family toxin [Rahnella aquatilis]AEX50041.1 plasmid stabilization system protein [Rahnella aquatilis CIP 78.65 = ATCC 33071]KFD00705.1 plasmid stabilization system protein [Rahnella aquatilis CIP 78.65 = ATCC 33071]
MSRYKIAREAQDDLFDIQRYSQAHWGKAQSDKYLSELSDLFSLLATHPDMGRPVSFHKDLFRFPHQHHVAYFLTTPAGLIFIAIMHKSRSPADTLSMRLHEPEASYQVMLQD